MPAFGSEQSSRGTDPDTARFGCSPYGWLFYLLRMLGLRKDISQLVNEHDFNEN